MKADRDEGWRSLLPGVAVLRSYQRSWLRPDVIAGLTVAAYLVPQVMAYAEIAKLPPVVGLWTCCLPLLIYALIGPSRQLSVGPESTTALMTAAGVGALVGTAGTDRWADVAALMAIAVGVVCLIGWVARLGFLANLLSRPVLQGYLVGIAVLMIGSQLGKVTKLKIDGDGPVAQVLSLGRQFGSIHVPTLVLALVVLALLLAAHRWRPGWPGPLLVMLLAAGATALLGAERWGLRVVGEVPRGLPAPGLPQLDVDLLALLPFAVGIALVGYSDNVLTSRAFATKSDHDTDASQELLALGAANVAAGLFHGFPVSSSGSRTALGHSAGSKTQVHSLVALAAVLLVLLVAGPVLATFPQAALGGVVMYAATRLVDVAEIRRIARFRLSEFILTIATAVGVIALGVLAGIGIAVVLSILDLIRRISHPHDGVLGYVPGVAGMHDVDDYPTATQVPGLVVYRYDSPLFFANAENFLHRAQRAVETAPTTVEWFLLNAEANVEVDLTAVDTLEQLRTWLAARGITFAMARVKQEVRDELSAGGFTQAVGDALIFATLPTAVAAYAADYEARHGVTPTGIPPR